MGKSRAAFVIALTAAAVLAGPQLAARTPTPPATATPADVAKMQQQMDRMREKMERLHRSTDPAERQTLVQEHMRLMQEQMAQMRRTGGPMMIDRDHMIGGMSSAKAAGDCARMMEQMQGHTMQMTPAHVARLMPKH
jgi:hypothetical protein